VSWRLNDVERLSTLTGRRLLRVAAAGDDEVEFIFERQPGEQAEKLVTIRLTLPPVLGEVDLVALEAAFERTYGLGVAVS
jgi:hypothetical protein